MDILLSIHPRHSEAILSGRKRFEFRRTTPKQPVKFAALYATAPVRAVVGVVEIKGVQEWDKEPIWEYTADGAGITRAEFDDYFTGKEYATAFCLGAVRRFIQPQPLEVFHFRRPPQSWAYLRKGQFFSAKPGLRRGERRVRQFKVNEAVLAGIDSPFPLWYSGGNFTKQTERKQK